MSAKIKYFVPGNFNKFFALLAAAILLGGACSCSTQLVIRSPQNVSPPPLETITLAGHPSEKFWEILKKHHLNPGLPFRLRNAAYWFSRPFVLSNHRPALIGIVTSHDKHYLRMFYISNSQSIWRVIPSMNVGIPKAPLYDKGDNEHSLDLPPQVQAFLAENHLGDSPIELPEEDLETIKKGALHISYDLDSMLSYSDSLEYVGNQVELEYLIKGVTAHAGLARNVPPMQVVISDSEDQPNFNTPILTFSLRNLIYGRLEASVYHSKNKRIEFTFVQDEKGRVFVSSITSSNSYLNSYGIADHAVIARDLTLPLWEYRIQVPKGFQGHQNSLQTEYFDTWAYLQQIPEIKKWYEAQKISIPDRRDHRVSQDL